MPAVRGDAPPFSQAAEAFPGAAQPAQVQHRPLTDLGGGLDNAQYSGGHARPLAWEQNHHQEASNGLPGTSEPNFAPADLVQALEAQKTNAPPDAWESLHRQEEVPHISGDTLVAAAAAGRNEDLAAGHAHSGRPDSSSGGEDRAAVEPMQVDRAPALAETSQALYAEPPLEHPAQQWQGDLSGGAWPTQHFSVPPAAGTREASMHSAELLGQQDLQPKRPAGDVLIETQEELSKQEPAVSTGTLIEL